MNVLIVSDGVPKPDRKMMGIFAFDQAKALAARGHNVCVAAINLRSFRYRRKYGFTKFVCDGVTIYEYSLPVGRVPFSLYQQIACGCLSYLYKKILQDGNKPDVVHAHFFDMICCAANVKKKFGYKLVGTEHFSTFLKKDFKKRSRLIKRASKGYKNVDRLFAVSNSLADVTRNECQKETYVIHNIVDCNTFTVPKRKVRHEGIKFVSVGRLSKSKNFPLLIDAFSEACKIRQDICLEIYGAGELKDSLEDQIKASGVSNNIKLCGFAERTKIATNFKSADCFILLSSYETFGVVYIEALSSGVPVIATRCGGPEDFVSEKNGMLVDCNNKEQTLAAILKMCDCYESYDAQSISDDIKRRFSPDTIASQLEQHYQFILEKNQ